MMNLLMLSTPVLISVVEVAANEQQSVNEENAHVNIEGMSTMEEVPRTSEDMDTEEGNDPMMKESENEKTKKQSEEANEEWKGVVFGESTSASRYAIEPLEDGVRLSSTNNGGKFQSSGSDGMTYYYQAIPKDINFRMRATIEIESWTYTNAQEGFALMVRDAVPKDHLFGQAFYSNSFAILGSRIEYVWDSDRQEVVNTSGSKYTMRLGLGTRAITGISSEDPQAAPAPGSVSVETTPLETSQLIAEKNPENKRPVLDFKGTGNGMTLFSHYWVLRGFDVTNSAAMQKGLQISGNHNLIEEIHAYRNGNTGIQISGSSNDPFEAWPAHNLVKNCTSFENADPGFEDADGFAAKLTIGEGNVFDGCIAYHNADDGWDLFAKNETGSIGKVVIKNSVAYRNGWVPGVEGEGNGNGFKMGGSSLSGPHELINSLSFENLAKGIDSNSGTDIIVNSSTSFNNGSYNVALYTSSAGNTDFHASGILSFRTENLEMREQIRPLNQNEDQIYHSLNYYWNEREKQSENTLGHTVSKDWIESLNTHSQEGQQPVTRYANGSIHVHGLMQIKPENRQTEKGRVDGLPLSVGATFDGETSPSSEYPEYAIVQEPNQTKPNEQNNPIIIQEANGVAENAEGNIIELKPFTVFVSTFTPNQGTPVFEDMRYFPEKIQIVETQSSTQFSNHTAIFSAPSKGEYTLEVTYRSEIFDGEKWSAHTESVTQQKAITVRETADVPPGNDKPERENPGNESPNGKPNGKPSHPDRTAKESEKNGTQGLPKTGEFNNPLLALAGGILLIGVVVYVMKQRKK